MRSRGAVRIGRSRGNRSRSVTGGKGATRGQNCVRSLMAVVAAAGVVSVPIAVEAGSGRAAAAQATLPSAPAPGPQEVTVNRPEFSGDSVVWFSHAASG